MHFSDNNELLTIGDNSYRVVKGSYREAEVELYTSHGRTGKGKERRETFTFVACAAMNLDCKELRIIIGSDGANMRATHDGMTHGLTPVEPSLYTDGQIHQMTILGVPRHLRADILEDVDKAFRNTIVNMMDVTGSEGLNEGLKL